MSSTNSCLCRRLPYFATRVDSEDRNPGVCAGLLTALGSGSQMEEVLRANDRVIAAPLRRLLRDGQEAGLFFFDDEYDTANSFLGATLTAVLGRALENRPLDEPDFYQQVAGQLVRSITVD